MIFRIHFFINYFKTVCCLSERGREEMLNMFTQKYKFAVQTNNRYPKTVNKIEHIFWK